MFYGTRQSLEHSAVLQIFRSIFSPKVTKTLISSQNFTNFWHFRRGKLENLLSLQKVIKLGQLQTLSERQSRLFHVCERTFLWFYFSLVL